MSAHFFIVGKRHKAKLLNMASPPLSVAELIAELDELTQDGSSVVAIIPFGFRDPDQLSDLLVILRKAQG